MGDPEDTNTHPHTKPHETPLVSVVIPTYNRFRYLMNTIQSVKDQTYKNTEIIVVNDCSTEQAYKECDWASLGVYIIHLEENSKKILGYGCAAHVRNKGIERCVGEYVAFCDDDDIWFPDKLELQITALETSACEMSCTDGFIGKGIFNKTKRYNRYNGQHYYKRIKRKHEKVKSSMMDNGFPQIWNEAFIKVHNAVICSSVVVKKSILDKINNMKCLPTGCEDRDCWRRIVKHTNIVYVSDVCFYYDACHGSGRYYQP